MLAPDAPSTLLRFVVLELTRVQAWRVPLYDAEMATLRHSKPIGAPAPTGKTAVDAAAPAGTNCACR